MLAIAFNDQYPEDVKKLTLPIGGRGIGVHNSLAQYLAREQRIQRGELRDAARNPHEEERAANDAAAVREGKPVTQSARETLLSAASDVDRAG